jgi:hypothetical protein
MEGGTLMTDGRFVSSPPPLSTLWRPSAIQGSSHYTAGGHAVSP